MAVFHHVCASSCLCLTIDVFTHCFYASPSTCSRGPLFACLYSCVNCQPFSNSFLSEFHSVHIRLCLHSILSVFLIVYIPLCLCSLMSVSYHYTSTHDRLVGLVVKAAASRAEDPGFESRLRRDFFRGRVITVISKLALQWLPCQALSIIGSVLGLAGPVSVTG